jgi:hypothetical protein
LKEKVMKNRFVSWIEPDRVALLLSQVSGPVHSQPLPFGGPPGGAGDVVIPEAPKPPKRLSHPPLLAPPLKQTSDNPSDRLDTLVAWTLDHQPCTGAFVADHNGLTLAAHGISEAHVSLVGPLLSSLVRIRSIPGVDGTSGALSLGDNMMSWVEARTSRGGFCLGAVGAEPLPTRTLAQLRDALEETVKDI